MLLSPLLIPRYLRMKSEVEISGRDLWYQLEVVLSKSVMPIKLRWMLLGQCWGTLGTRPLARSLSPSVCPQVVNNLIWKRPSRDAEMSGRYTSEWKAGDGMPGHVLTLLCPHECVFHTSRVWLCMCPPSSTNHLLQASQGIRNTHATYSQSRVTNNTLRIHSSISQLSTCSAFSPALNKHVRWEMKVKKNWCKQCILPTNNTNLG